MQKINQVQIGMEMVSAIITTHNREPKLIQRAIKSVCTQTYKNIEIIVVDDSDPDYCNREKVKGVVESFTNTPFPVYYIQHSKCFGLSKARNTGLAKSQGCFIAFLDDDDEWLPEKTAQEVLEFNKSHETALVYCGGYQVDDNSGEITVLEYRFLSGNVFDQLLYGNWIGYPSFVMFRKEYITSVGNFDENITFMEDYDVYLRLARQYKISFVPKELAVYHEHQGEQMTDDLYRYIKGLNYIAFKYKHDYLLNKKAYVVMQKKMALAYSETGNVQLAVYYWIKIAKRAPYKISFLLTVLFKIFINVIRNR